MAKRFILVAVILTLGFAAASAWAVEGPFYAGYGGYGAAMWGNNYGYQGLNQERHPYFAMYPPVYYSYIEPRTFGQSPYAYLPPVAPVSSQGNQPAYYQQQQGMQQQAPAQQQPVRPLMIRNPYVPETVTPPPPAPASR